MHDDVVMSVVRAPLSSINPKLPYISVQQSQMGEATAESSDVAEKVRSYLSETTVSQAR